MTNMDLYNRVRKVPTEAQKPITGGRLKGMTDINPMWRIEKLTGEFGVCGFGWYTEITKQWIEDGADGERTAHCNINLLVRIGDEWSKPIQGTGGAALIASERNGLYTSDECYKMAYTDALSVACKLLGIGADIYYAKSESKYQRKEESEKPDAPSVKTAPAAPVAKPETGLTREQAKEVMLAANGDVTIVNGVLMAWGYRSSQAVPQERYDELKAEVSKIASSSKTSWAKG